MNMGKLVEWGGIILVALLLWRWLSGVLSGTGDSSALQNTWQPNIYPYGIGQGVVYLSPGMVGPRFNPGTWTGRRRSR